MVAHQKSSPGRKISSKLLALLAGLDEMVPDFDWKVLGVGVDGLFNLLGFKSFLTYQEFMIACGFVGRSYRGNNKPYFLANRFQEEASQQFRPLTRGKEKHWFIPVGRKKHRKPKSCGKEWVPPRIKLNWKPIVHFWSSPDIKRWMDNEQEVLGDRKRQQSSEKLLSPSTRPPARTRPRVQPTPAWRKVTSQEETRKNNSPSFASPGITGPFNRLVAIKSPSLNPTMDPSIYLQRSSTTKRLAFTPVNDRLPISSSNRGASNRGASNRVFPTPTPAKAIAKLARQFGLASVRDSTAQPDFMNPTVSSQSRQAENALFELANRYPAFGGAISRAGKQLRPQPKLMSPIKASAASRRTAASDIIEPEQIFSPDYPLEIRKVFQPKIYQTNGEIRKAPPGMEYKGVKINGEEEMLHFHVSKGWNVIIHCIKKRDGTNVQTLVVLPSRMTIIDKTQKSKIAAGLHDHEAKLEKLEKKLSSVSRFDWCDKSRRLIGGILAFQPKISSLAWEGIFPFIVGSFLIDIGHAVDSEQLANMTPCRQTIENILLDFAVESAMLVSDAINHSRIFYISYDKADSNKGMGGCVKLGATWDFRLETEEFPDGRPVVATIDADKSGDSSIEVAESVSHSINKMDLNEDTECHGLTSDSGGGGAVESGGEALDAEKQLAAGYLVGNCTCHNINLECVVPMKKILMGNKPDDDDGDKKKGNKAVPRNVEQMLYTAYAWEHEVGLNVTKEYWHSSAEFCHEKFGELLEDDNNSYDDLEQFEEVLLMFLNLKKGEKFVLMTRGAETR
jgi:hypothetical protein